MFNLENILILFLNFSSNYINAHVPLDKLEKPKKLSLEEEFLMSAGRNRRRASSTAFQGTGDFKTKNMIMTPHQNGIDNILASTIMSYAIAEKVNQTDYFLTPSGKEWSLFSWQNLLYQFLVSTVDWLNSG